MIASFSEEKCTEGGGCCFKILRSSTLRKVRALSGCPEGEESSESVTLTRARAGN